MIQNKTEVLNLKSRKTQVPIGYLTLKSFQEYVVQQLPAQCPTNGSFGKQTVFEVICFNFQRS
jgi:hypothetical protein